MRILGHITLFALIVFGLWIYYITLALGFGYNAMPVAFDVTWFCARMPFSLVPGLEEQPWHNWAGSLVQAAAVHRLLWVQWQLRTTIAGSPE